MGRGRLRTAATITVAAGLVVALVALRTGGDDWDPLMASGTVALEPTLVAPRQPVTAPSPSTLEQTSVPRATINGSTSETPRTLGVQVGSVGGLYPGARVRLGVRYRNPYSFPIVIDTVRARARGTDLCRGRNLVWSRAPRLRLPSHSSVAAKISVKMRRSAPDACQGVRFAVRVRVTAVKL